MRESSAPAHNRGMDTTTLRILPDELTFEDLDCIARGRPIGRSSSIASWRDDVLRVAVCQLALDGLIAQGKLRSVLDMPDGAERTAALLRLSTTEDTVRYHGPMHKARKLNRLVPWADRDAMLAKYVEARLRTERTGVPHVVDHITPFKGEVVSGLHCEHNLQVITADANQQKYNKHEP